MKRFWRSGGEDKSATFGYAKPFEWHFKYRHTVDNHNNLRHAVLSIEGTWTTDRWPVRVFQFLLAITEINTYLVIRHFVFKTKDPQVVPKLLAFRRELAWLLIDNEFFPKTTEENKKVEEKTLSENNHWHAVAPKNAHYFNGRRWILGAKDPYQQYQCKWPGCKKRCRHFCVCNPSVWLCSNCHVQHCIDCVRAA